MRQAIAVRLRLLGMLRAAGAWPVTGIVVITLAGSLLPAATAMALAWLIGRLAEAVSAGAGVLAALALPLTALAGVMLVGHVLDAVQEPLHFLVKSRVDGAYRKEVGRLAAASDTIDALERPEVQHLVQFANADALNWYERTPGAGAVALMLVLGRAVTLASISLIIVAFAWWLVPLLAIPAVIMRRLSRNEMVTWTSIWRERHVNLRRARVWLDASRDAATAKELRIFGLGEYAIDRVAQHTEALFLPVWAHVRAAIGRHWRQFLLTVVPLAVGFVAVAHAAATGRTSVTIATAVLSAGPAVYRVFGDDPRDVIGAINTLDAYDKLRAELGRPEEEAVRVPLQRPPEISAPRPIAQDHDSIRFEEVSFTYPDTTREVLSGLSLEIRPRELLAVVGRNGAGKSTLIKLLAGLYEPTGGRITYGGRDIREIGIREWRRHLSVVFQDFVRYHLSAADNVALGNADVPVDSEAIEAAAHDAGLDAVLERLPEGWDTPLSRSRSDGVDLSGGQWQHVVLTRALYAVRTGAHVLVLDEPTAHLDVATEFKVFGRLAAHKGDASVVLISHRLSTVRQADRIVLLDGGKITESGSHDELMALRGRYAELFTIQAGRFNRGYDDRIEEGGLR